MIEMLRRLLEHMAWADNMLLNAIGECSGAFDDEELRKWLLHIVAVQRFFLSLFLQQPFDAERENKASASLDQVASLFQEAHADAMTYVDRLDDAELRRQIPMPRMKEFQPSVRDLLLQVVMHGEHHRAQCATRLRALGGKPSVTDYIAWVRVQPGAAA